LSNGLYLGKKINVSTWKEIEEFYLDPDDLTTHGVIIGMTGSGKTGAAIVLIEELILKNIPVIIIDPKGDAINIALRFPELSPNEFKKWIDPLKAERDNMSVDEYAKRISEIWRKGILKYVSDLSIVKELAKNSEILIFTPGYSGGLTISVLHDLNMPEKFTWNYDEELLLEKIKNTVSAILELANRDSDPLRSNEHILISRIIEYSWRQGIKLDFSKLLAFIMEPPFNKIGAIDVDLFMSPKDRKQLAIDINKIIASSSFRAWLSGVPLDFENLLWSNEGKPRIIVFYLSHLDDVQKMFAVTLILQNLYSWMFKQSGSSKLRTLLYFDEVYGYIPPYPKNPPSKRLLMLLMKQARAFGLGIVLSTQNPVDIDYKALSNAGIWMIGRLQTENDKARVIEGLKIASDTLGESLDINEISQIITSLRKRMFLIHNIHENKNIIFHTRWAYSYLRGPLTLLEVKKLIEEINTGLSLKTISLSKLDSSNLLSLPPKISSKITQLFLPIKISDTSNNIKVYYPILLVRASVSINRSRPPISVEKEMVYTLPTLENFSEHDLNETAYTIINPSNINEKDLSFSWDKELKFYDIPNVYSSKNFIRTLHKMIKDYILKTYSVSVYRHKDLKIYSEINESLDNFLSRINYQIETKLKEQEEKIIEKYKKKFESIRNKIKSKEEKIKVLNTEIKGLERQLSLYGAGAAFSLFSKRSAYYKITAAARIRERINIKREKIKSLELEIKHLESKEHILAEELKEKLEKIRKEAYLSNNIIEKITIKPRKRDIKIDNISIIWVPVILEREKMKIIKNLYTGETIIN